MNADDYAGAQYHVAAAVDPLGSTSAKSGTRSRLTFYAESTATGRTSRRGSKLH